MPLDGSQIAAICTGVGALLAGYGAYKKARNEAAAVATAEASDTCNERLLTMMDEHMRWAERVILHPRETPPPLPGPPDEDEV